MSTLSPPQTQINSVIALYSNGQIQEALDAVEALIKDYPNEALLYNISGICYKTIGKLDKAVKNFEKAIAIKPDYAEVYYNLGVTLQDLGQLDAAVKSYEKALAIKPDYAEAFNNLGHVYSQLNDYVKAIESYERGYQINKDLDYIITLCSPTCVSILKKLSPDYLKVASRDLTNIPLLEALAETKTPIILSTGIYIIIIFKFTR